MPRGISEILASPDPFSQDDLVEMRKSLTELEGWVNQSAFFVANTRMSIELISSISNLQNSIKHFDKTSGELVETTNRLTKRIFWLTIVGISLAVIQAIEGAVSLFSSK